MSVCTVVLTVHRIVVEVHVDAVVNFLLLDYKTLVFEKFQRSVHECMQACRVFTQLHKRG